MTAVLNLLGPIDFGREVLFNHRVSPLCTNIAIAFSTAASNRSCNGCVKPIMKIAIPDNIINQRTV
jgi:hypothetical protein